MSERITFTTLDGIVIVGDWTPAPTVIGAVVLLHQMPETRASWAELERVLAKRSIASLAIDLRGHGESTTSLSGEIFDYREFEDADHQTSILDVMAAVDWVRRRGLDRERIALAGASIGANLAVQMLTEEPRLAGAVLLSPGENYRGIKAQEDIQNLVPGQSLLIVSSEEDTQSFIASKTLFDQAPIERKKFIPYKSAGHGTHMFQVERALTDIVADWLAESTVG